MNRYLKKDKKIKILFVLQSIGFGGSMTSLINLLGFLKNNEDLSIDVLFMDRYGGTYRTSRTGCTYFTSK